MPSGGMVAGFEMGEKNEVAFWEKNGLRHGEFIIPE
jgi:hypothetical protein